MKTYLLLIFFIAALFPICASAQSGKEDVIYLKNGTMYRGTMLHQEHGVSYKIQIAGGSVIVVAAADIDHITKEAKVYTQGTNDTSGGYIWDDRRRRYIKNRVLPPYGYKDKGGFFQAQLNGQFAGGSLRAIGGYKINQFAMLGIGLGIGGIAHGANQPFFIDGVPNPYGGLYVPIFLYYSGDILKKDITPFYAIEIGYGIGSSPFQQGDNDYTYPVHYTTGGYMGSAGFGARFYAGRKFVCSISLALDIQQARTETFYLAPSNAPYIGYTGSMTMLLPTFKIGIGILK